MVAHGTRVEGWRECAVETLAIAGGMYGVNASVRIALHPILICIQAMVRIWLELQDVDA